MKRRVVINAKTRHDAESRLRQRTLRVGREIESRPSIAEEDEITAEVRAKERREDERRRQAFIGHVADADAQIRRAMEEWWPPDRLSQTDLRKVRELFGRLRDRHS